MIIKLYEKIKKIIKDDYKFILEMIILFLVLTIKLPYYIETPGGLINIASRVEVENANKINGSLNLAYVSSFKATIPTLVYAFINPSWDIYKKAEIESAGSSDELDYANHLLLEEANDNALIVAFEKNNEYYKITERKVFIAHLVEEANTDLKIGDEIISLNGIKISSKDELIKLIEENEGKMNIKVRNKNELYDRYAYKSNIGDRNIIGVTLCETKEIETNRNVKFKFKSSESGPSGGFMMSLAIYNYLNDIDLTNNLTIVGTGTIDEAGNVGMIGGIEYKIKGAVKSNADLFFVPVDNYEEALNVVNSNNFNIKLYKVSHIDDAINYLKNLD